MHMQSVACECIRRLETDSSFVNLSPLHSRSQRVICAASKTYYTRELKASPSMSFFRDEGIGISAGKAYAFGTGISGQFEEIIDTSNLATTW